MAKKVIVCIFVLRIVMPTCAQNLSSDTGEDNVIDSSEVSDDIVIIGIDKKTTEILGRWPFRRKLIAEFLETLTEIEDQTHREKAVCLNLFYFEPDTRFPADDELLMKSIEQNGRVILSADVSHVWTQESLTEEYLNRLNDVQDKFNRFDRIFGNWKNLYSYRTIITPLKEFSQVSFGIGQALITKDINGYLKSVPLLIKHSHLEKYTLDRFDSEEALSLNRFAFLTWVDKSRKMHVFPHNLRQENFKAIEEEIKANGLIEKIDIDGDGNHDEETQVIRKIENYFMPSTALLLYLLYINKGFNDVEVNVGKSVSIKNVDSGLNGKNIEIPIDDSCHMTISFDGRVINAQDGSKFIYYPFYLFIDHGNWDAGSWLKYRSLKDKIVLVGLFDFGFDFRLTREYGLMCDIEILANAINTIIMRNF